MFKEIKEKLIQFKIVKQCTFDFDHLQNVRMKVRSTQKSIASN